MIKYKEEYEENKIIWDGKEIYLFQTQYNENKNTALLGLEMIDDDCLTIGVTISVNTEVDLCDGFMFVKNYSENKGILEALQESGIVTETIGEIPSGYVKLQLVGLMREFPDINEVE